MSVLDRKLRRELWTAKLTLLGITSIITVGIGCFITMRSVYYDLRTAQADYYAQCRMADFWINLKKAPTTELDRLAQLPGVARIQPRIEFAATVDIPDVPRPLNGLVLSLPERRGTSLNDIVIRQGGYFSDVRPDQVIVSDAFAQANGLAPGDVIHLLLNNRRQAFSVVGTAIGSEFVYLVSPGSLAPDPEHFGVFYIKHDYAEEIFDMDGAANQVVGRVSADRQGDVDAILERAERLLEPFGVAGTTPRREQVSHQFLDAEIEGLGVFAQIVPAIFLSVAALVLNVLMTRLAQQQRTVIGTLKALGYSDRQVSGHFVKFGLCIGVLGGICGCLFGYLLAALVINYVYPQFFAFPSLQTHLYPAIYLIGIAISLACALVGSLRGARAALRLRPAEAMRAKPPARGGRIWLERLGWLWRRLSFAWRMALRNVVRNRVRTAVGVFSAAMGTSLLVITFMSVAALDFMIDFQYNKISTSDIDLTFESTKSESATYAARRLPGVDYAEPLLGVACTFRHGRHRQKGSITGLTPGARLTQPRDLEGRRLPTPDAGLLMTRKMAELLDLEVGDQVEVRPTRGLRRVVRAPVVRISESYLGKSVYADIDYLSRLLGEARVVSGVQLQVDPSPAVRRTLYRELKRLPAVEGVAVRADAIANMNETLIESQNQSIGILVLFAGVIFFGSILNASLVSLAERQREIATLRVLGYSELQIGLLLLRESVLVNLLGTVVGLPLGYAQFAAMAEAYDMELYRLPIVAPPWVWLATVIAAVVFVSLAQAAVQWRIHQTRWLEALSVKE